SGEAGAIGGCYSLNTEYLFPYLIISAYKRQKTYPKNLPNIIGPKPSGHVPTGAVCGDGEVSGPDDWQGG
ncbi:MAG: hypothetical protein KIH09_13705, partial [Candidatus Freyarchaeota archaeon]|nr:hypothetical protein [Candidatus Jordarchaeia archaeon]